MTEVKFGILANASESAVMPSILLWAASSEVERHHGGLTEDELQAAGQVETNWDKYKQVIGALKGL